ncbi:MAG: hypothetical protein V3R88_11935 [Alphaproteobacteria bacterium]
MTDAEILAGFIRDMARDAIETHGEETPARAAAAAVKCRDEGWTLYEELWARIGKAAEAMLAHGEGTVH